MFIYITFLTDQSDKRLKEKDDIRGTEVTKATDIRVKFQTQSSQERRIIYLDLRDKV